MPDPGPDLQQVLAHAIKRTTDEYDLDPDHAPSTTVSIARWTHTVLDLLVLGDSPVVVFTRDGQHTMVTDERLSRVTAEIRKVEPRPDLHSLVTGQRKRRNKPDGCWIVETDPHARYARDHETVANQAGGGNPYDHRRCLKRRH
jgi:hypothetical protein